MALQKNIKEVESTEAGFVANAAAKNDGFLTDVIGYPMIKRRGNDYDYWFPEKSRDELGTYTYYDKTVKDLTALNDCIVQRRLSSYGDADTYFDFSTDDQIMLNVGGVPFLTVAESGGAAVGTLGGNLALGANTISRDGAANKGFGFSTGGTPLVTATPVTFGDARTVLRLSDDTAFEEGVGAGITLYGKTKEDGTYAVFGGIKVSKENGVSGDDSSSFYIQTRKQGSEPANALRLDSSQNGYIRNKLIVGSLDKTPENQLVVYNAEATDSFIQVSNGVTGSETGLIVGVDHNGDAVLRVDTGKYLKFQSLREDFGVPKDIATLRYTDTTQFRVIGEIQCEKLRVGSLIESENQLVVYNAGETDTFIQVSNGVTSLGSGAGLRVGVDHNGDAVLRVDTGKYLKFQSEDEGGVITMATLRDYGILQFRVNGDVHCDNLNTGDLILRRDPIAGTITPDKYIIINCNGTNYKIPVAAA